MILEKKKVLVVAAHPDDEVLGCGATIARLRQAGATVSVVLLGEGPVSRDGDGRVRQLAIESAVQAGRVFGVESVEVLGFPDNAFDSVPLIEIVKAIEVRGRVLCPDLIFTHHVGDLNVDHGLTCRAVLTAFRPLPGDPHVAILGFEVLSSTEYSPVGLGAAFVPNVYVDVATSLEKKIEALGAYASEMRDWPHPRSLDSVRHLAMLRGAHCGCAAAEAFFLYRSLE